MLLNTGGNVESAEDDPTKPPPTSKPMFGSIFKAQHPRWFQPLTAFRRKVGAPFCTGGAVQLKTSPGEMKGGRESSGT